MQQQLQVAFLPLDSELAANHWTNKAAACISSSDLIHCELVLPTAKREAFSITAGGKVFLTDKKQFSRTHWRFINVITTPAQNRALMEFARAQVDKPFNSYGYYLTPLGGWSGGNKSWYCSELCCAALQAIGIDIPTPAHKTTPGRLWNDLMQCSGTVKSAHPKRVVLELSL